MHKEVDRTIYATIKIVFLQRGVIVSPTGRFIEVKFRNYIRSVVRITHTAHLKKKSRINISKEPGFILILTATLRSRMK